MAAHQWNKSPSSPTRWSLGEPPHPCTRGLVGHHSVPAFAHKHVPVCKPGGCRLNRQPFSSRLGLPWRDEGGELHTVTSHCHQCQGRPTSSDKMLGVRASVEDALPHSMDQGSDAFWSCFSIALPSTMSPSSWGQATRPGERRFGLTQRRSSKAMENRA